MTSFKKLPSNPPASNLKIIDLYEKIRTQVYKIDKAYQRKLVWKKQHKIAFIETILLNYPFPEIYISQGKVDTKNLKAEEFIVDGQQRITTIVSYIEGKDVFSLKLPYKSFESLSDIEKTEFLNYEISVRYLKGLSIDEVKSIFLRINSTEYALNSIEKMNAQYGSSEFIYFCRQIFDTDFKPTEVIDIEYTIPQSDRERFHEHLKRFEVFTSNDWTRMIALQIGMILISSMLNDEYFNRADKINEYIEKYNDTFPEAETLKNDLLKIFEIVSELGFPKKSFWLNKVNFFSLVCELYKIDFTKIQIGKLKPHLDKIEERYILFFKSDGFEGFKGDEIKYFEFVREGVNQKTARDHRGKVLHDVLLDSIKP